jgi:hypothetical protein
MPLWPPQSAGQLVMSSPVSQLPLPHVVCCMQSLAHVAALSPFVVSH